MNRKKRRSLSFLCSCSLVPLLSGCLSRAPIELVDVNENTMNFEVERIEQSGGKAVIEGGLPGKGFSLREDHHYATLISTEEGTSAFNFQAVEGTSRAEEFVEDTNFESSEVLVIQQVLGSNSCDFTVDKINRKNDVVHAYTSIKCPSGPLMQAIEFETLLVRIHTSKDFTPSQAIITVDKDGQTTTYNATELTTKK